MKFRNVLVTAILFLGLGSYVFFFERHQKSTDQLAKPDLTVLKLPAGIPITGLTLQFSNQPQILLEKEGGKWFLRQPQAMEADSDTVEALLSQLGFLKAVRMVRPPKKGENINLSQYGLETSNDRICVRTASGQKVLVFGGKTPIGDSMYAKVDGEHDIYVISKDYVGVFSKKQEEFRNKVVIEIDLGRIDWIKVQNSAGTFDVRPSNSESGANWRWAATADKKLVLGKDVDQEAVNALVWELRRLKFKDYLGQQEPKDSGLKNPIARVDILLKDQKTPIVLRIGATAPDGSSYARVDVKSDFFTLEAGPVGTMKKDLSKSISSPVKAKSEKQK